MPIDASIYGQLQPNLAMGAGDLVNKYVDQTQSDAANRNKLAQMAQQGQLQTLQLQQAKQQAEDESALRQAYKESAGDTSGMVQKLRAQGLHAQADQLIKSQAEQQKANMEMGLKRHEGLATVAGDIANNPTQWQGVIQNSVKAGILHPDDAQTMAQHFSSLPPEQIAPEAQKGMVMVKDASAKMAEQLYQKPNMHVIEEDNVQKVVNLNDPNAPKVFGAKPKQNNWAVLQTDNGIVQVNPKTGDIRKLGVNAPVKAGAAASSKTQHVADAKESNALLDQVEKVGDLATGSGAGKLRDMTAGFFGKSTEGANYAAKLKVLGASLTAKVPKMSGPQSDKDVAMYKEAAGNIADPSMPWEQKKAAIDTIREINNRQLSYGNDISSTPENTGGESPDIDAILNKHGVK